MADDAVLSELLVSGGQVRVRGRGGTRVHAKARDHHEGELVGGAASHGLRKGDVAPEAAVDGVVLAVGPAATARQDCHVLACIGRAGVTGLKRGPRGEASLPEDWRCTRTVQVPPLVCAVHSCGEGLAVRPGEAQLGLHRRRFRAAAVRDLCAEE